MESSHSEIKRQGIRNGRKGEVLDKLRLGKGVDIVIMFRGGTERIGFHWGTKVSESRILSSDSLHSPRKSISELG